MLRRNEQQTLQTTTQMTTSRNMTKKFDELKYLCSQYVSKASPTFAGAQPGTEPV